MSPAPIASTSVSPAPGKTHSGHAGHGFSTKAIHIGSEPSEETGAVIPAISLSTTFKQKSVGDFKYEYSRSANPTRDSLERALAALEGGRFGLAFASGSSVTATIVSALPPKSHIVSVNDVYGGTYRYFTKVATLAQGIETTFAELANADTQLVEQNLRKAMRSDTKLVWIESPTNPTLRLIDIPFVVKIAKSINPETTVVVDSTFLSPWYQNPLSLGADIVAHSITKYINGHSDVVMGALVTNSSAWVEKLKFLQNSIGAVPSAFDSWLALRGIKTLAVRMQEHGSSALIIAKALTQHPAVKDVIYPGLPSHPSFQLAQRQIAPKAFEKAVARGTAKGDGIEANGFPYGGMVTIRLASDARDEQAANKVLERLQIFTLAESLGGVESLVEQPSKMTHAAVSQEDRDLLGIGHNLIRISVGLEDVEDLLADLDQAFRAAGLA